MNNQSEFLSETSIKGLRGQGFYTQSLEELNAMAFGIRFAYRLCVVFLLVALVTQSITLFAVMAGISLLGVILRNHPFDYIYNHFLSEPMGRPKVPRRSIQLKFTCGIATLWLSTIVFLCAAGMTVAANVMASVLLVMAILPSTIDVCIPSVLFNRIFRRPKAETL